MRLVQGDAVGSTLYYGKGAGADYVAFGAIYPTTTKDAKTSAPIELVKWWGEVMTTPLVAIGGITVENAAPVIKAGADFTSQAKLRSTDATAASGDSRSSTKVSSSSSVCIAKGAVRM